MMGAMSWQTRTEKVCDGNDLVVAVLTICETQTQGAQSRTIAALIDTAELSSRTGYPAGAGSAAFVVNFLAIIQVGLLPGVAVTVAIGFNTATSLA